MFRINLAEDYTAEYADRVNELHKAYCPSEYILNDTHEQLADLFNGFSVLESREYNPESALNVMWNWIVDGNDGISDAKVFEVFIRSLPFFTTYLSIELPESF